MRKALLLMLVLAVTLPGLALARSKKAKADDGDGASAGQTVFLKQNLQVTNGKGYSTWFSSLPSDVELVPAGSKVTIEKISNKGFVLGTDQGKIKFEYQPKWYDMSTDEFLARITSASDPRGAWAGFSALDKEGIKLNRIKVGMSKAAVLVAVGYPPATKTSDISSSAWIYQRNRFVWVNVKFNGDKVSQFGSEK